MQLLIEKRASIETQMCDEISALHFATEMENQTIMQLMFEKGVYAESREIQKNKKDDIILSGLKGEKGNTTVVT